jgi:hypothetical protein
MLSGVWAWVCSLGPVRWLLPLLPTWLVVEVAFFVYLRYIVLPSLNNLTEPEPASDADSPWEQFHKIIDLVTDLGVRPTGGLTSWITVCEGGCL